MKRVLFWSALLAISACAHHAPPVGPAVADQAGVVIVKLSDFAYAPERLRLAANRPVRLRLVNTSGGGHNFSAPTFFAASQIADGSSVPKDGAIEVPGHGTVEVALTPVAPGRYDVVCTHPLHELFGMAGGVEVTP